MAKSASIILKFVLVLCASLMFNASAFSADEEYDVGQTTARIEIGIGSMNNSSVSSSPVSGVGLKANTAYGLNIVVAPATKEVGGLPIEFSVGFMANDNDITLAGRNLGSTSSTLVYGTARLVHRKGPLQPYVGLGVGYRSMDDSSMGAGLRLKVDDKVGVVGEIGAVYLFPKGSFIDGVDVNLRHFGGVKGRLETMGGGKVTETDFGAGTTGSFSVFKRFNGW